MEAEAKKKKRSVLKREKRDERKAAAMVGPSVAKLKNVPTSPRKMRLVADLIRGERVNKALNILKYEPKVGAPKLEKLLLSAISGWEAKHQDVKLEEAAPPRLLVATGDEGFAPVFVPDTETRVGEQYNLDNFYRAVREGARVPNDGRENLRTLAVAEAFIRSARENREIAVADVG